MVTELEAPEEVAEYPAREEPEVGVDREEESPTQENDREKKSPAQGEESAVPEEGDDDSVREISPPQQTSWPSGSRRRPSEEGAPVRVQTPTAGTKRKKPEISAAKKGEESTPRRRGRSAPRDGEGAGTEQNSATPRHLHPEDTPPASTTRSRKRHNF